MSAVKQGMDLLEVARETGLRQHLHGVDATNARVMLRRFVAALACPECQCTTGDVGPVSESDFATPQVSDLHGEVLQFITDTPEDATHKHLVSLGWTPPQVSGSAEDLEARARGLLDTSLRALGLHEDAYHVGCGADLDQNDKAAINAIITALSAPQEGRWINADDVDRLVRVIDVALNGEAGAAKQAALCDIAGQCQVVARVRGCPILSIPQARPVEAKPERRAPVQRYHGKTIPWRVHGLAWEAYANAYGRAQDAERIAVRGGFGIGEMDRFLPGWRDMADAIDNPAPAPDVARLVEAWEARARSAHPSDAMLINKHIRELLEALTDAVQPGVEGEG